MACGNSGNQPEDTGKQEERDAQEGVGGQEDRDVSQNATKQDTDSFVIADLAGLPSDYAQEENWLKIPEITHEVDTFYLYLTCYIDEAEDAKPICDIDNKEMQAHPEYYERMVAAYPIGYSITRDWLEEHPYLKFAQGADDTGVIVSWNTEGKGNKGQNNLVVEPNAISIKPINWNSDKTLFIAFINCYILSAKSPQTPENAIFIASEFALRLSLVLYPFLSCYEPS